MEKLSIIINSFEFQTIIKLLLGVILAGIIGLERSSWSKPAGFRTHALVGISAVLVMSFYYIIIRLYVQTNNKNENRKYSINYTHTFSIFLLNTSIYFFHTAHLSDISCKLSLLLLFFHILFPKMLCLFLQHNIFQYMNFPDEGTVLLSLCLYNFLFV